MKKNKIDIISDIHIEYWTKNIKRNYDIGLIEDYPFKLKNTDSKYLIIAGDISDNLDDSIYFLKEAKKYYDLIIFVDGNHEHFNIYPELYDTNYINKRINDEKIYYLSKKSCIIDSTVFIGCNGWWDYNNNNMDTIKKYLEKGHLKRFNYNTENKIKLINNIIKTAYNDFLYLNNEIKKYDNDINIKNIIIVTHTIPNTNFGFNNKNDYLDNNFGTQFNTNFNNLYKSNKISKWIFGHVHGNHNEINNIHYICNPRGGPTDYSRKIYNVETILI